jgi:hypothetical protein
MLARVPAASRHFVQNIAAPMHHPVIINAGFHLSCADFLQEPKEIPDIDIPIITPNKRTNPDFIWHGIRDT